MQQRQKMWAVVCNAKLPSNRDSGQYIKWNINKQTDITVVITNLHALCWLCLFLALHLFIVHVDGVS